MAMPLILVAAAICVANVHDGDSIRLCDGERIRIANIDAPEMSGSPKCQRGRNGWCDYRLAVQSRDALQGLLASGPVTVTRQGKDAYGRTLARVSVNGQDAGQFLVRLGLAHGWK